MFLPTRVHVGVPLPQSGCWIQTYSNPFAKGFFLSRRWTSLLRGPLRGYHATFFHVQIQRHTEWMPWIFLSIGIISNQYAFPPPVIMPKLAGRFRTFRGSMIFIVPFVLLAVWMSEILRRATNSKEFRPTNLFSSLWAENWFFNPRGDKSTPCTYFT